MTKMIFTDLVSDVSDTRKPTVGNNKSVTPSLNIGSTSYLTTVGVLGMVNMNYQGGNPNSAIGSSILTPYINFSPLAPFNAAAYKNHEPEEKPKKKKKNNILQGAADGVMWIYRNTIGKVAANITQEGMLPEAFDLGGFYRDDKKIYHAKQTGSLQSIPMVGYNDFYDYAFDLATSMDVRKFEFTSNGVDYIFWAWKGDYLNLGAGAEMGIYRRAEVNGIKTDHWLVDNNLAMPMTLKLDHKGHRIIDYDPKVDDPEGQQKKKWWVTSFNPEEQGVKADNLFVTYTVDFKDNPEMFDDFYNEYKNKPKQGWKFNTETKVATLFF